MKDSIDETIDYLNKIVKEDLNKECNKDLELNIGGVKISKDSLELKDKTISCLREAYDLIKQTIEKYVDLNERYYSLITLWILGTYFHDDFESYPYLFFNAMRGSGKSRTLKLICTLSKEGNVMASPTEAVLFRVSGTLGIDEFEGLAGKDKATIRELLNSAYKKGTKVFRMKKKKTINGEELIAEEFEPYRPICMANIYGMEEVLGDRCITLILEKSNDPVKIRLVENFEDEENIKKTFQLLNQCSLCNVVMEKNIYKCWNNYILDRYNNTLTTYYTYNTINTQTTKQHILLDNLFNKIHDSEVKGRNLELFLPLFFIANIISKKILEETIETAKIITEQKKSDESLESLDVLVYDFISKQNNVLEYISVKELTERFKQFSEENAEWLNSKWFGRALKRLNLVLDKKRKGHGIEVMLNVNKALEKLKIFSGEKCQS
jgi:hypothetical protein